MKIGAFDQPERDPESIDPDIDGDGIEGVENDEMADDEMA
jgi:ParB family chromosome partitioning protein